MNNKHQKKQLDRYSIMIVSKYFKTIGDFIKLIKICKKIKEIPEMFHYNPVSLQKKTKLFPNIETYHVYRKNERVICGYEKHVYWYQVNYETYLKKKENDDYKNVRFSPSDWEKYKSFKGANILGENSLSHCTLIEIDLNGITKLESCSFIGNQCVERIKLDNKIMIIPGQCFANCISLIELDLSCVKILGNNCFSNCSSLTALTLPEVLYEIGINCFVGINDLEKIETKGIKLIGSNMNYSLYKSFKRNRIDVKGSISFGEYDRIKYGIEIPEEVSILGIKCFNNVTTLGEVILPKSITKLMSYCFDKCSIKSIDLSHVIENYCTFEECNELTSITLNKNLFNPKFETPFSIPFYNRLTSLKNIELSDTKHIPIVSNHLCKLMNEKGYLYDKCIYNKFDFIEMKSNIPPTVNNIDRYVLYCERNVEKLVIPSSVSHIDEGNFYWMYDLESIEIQSTNIQCGHYCFNNIPNIKELDLRGVTSFGISCICDCSSLTKVIVRNVSIENGLMNCASLKTIEIIGIENNEYEHPVDIRILRLFKSNGIRCNKIVFYKYEGVDNEETYRIPDDVNEIHSYSFEYSFLKEITIPSSVTLIKTHTFDYCNDLTRLVIEGNPQIEKDAFYGCLQLIQNQPELKQYQENIN